uniref:WAPL domain-containing protein n=1 Tax=Macrostomum lignano TaxID=282301 RepID=A0A1I8J079_9PLAT
MLDLLERLLVHGDLSVGSQLFSLDNETVLSEADEALAYSSAVELCVARICRSLKETGKLEAHLPALLKLLARCAELPLAGNVSGSDGCGSDPLPVRLASDLLSCLF